MFLILPTILAIILGIPLALVAAALSFYPINNRPFSYFLEALYNYLTKDKLYLWHRKANVVYNTQTVKKTQEPVVAPSNRGTNHKSITSLTRKLELQALQKPDQ